MNSDRSVLAVDDFRPYNDSQKTAFHDPRKPGDHVEHAHTSSTAGLIANIPSSSRPLRAPLPSYIFQEWKWEFLTWTLGTAAMACIVVLLSKFQNKPVSHWHSEVSITAMVASLAQVAQSALMAPVASCIGQLKWHWLQKGHRTYDVDIYDDASRGPAGSLWILLTTKPQLVTLGALVTLFTLLFPTFVQQALGTNLQLLDRNGTSMFATALNYTIDQQPAQIFMGGYNFPDWLGESYDPYMISAIRSGMIDRYKSLSNISAPCSTTYCAWQNYSTLAICSSVEEVSSDIYEYYTNDTGVGWFPHFTLRQLDARQPGIVRQNEGDYDFLVASLSYKNPFGYSTTNTTDDRMSDMVNVFTLFHDPCLQSGREGWDYAYNASTFRAFKGTLRLCVQTLDSTFNNTMNTTVVMTHDDLVWQKTNVTYMVDSQVHEGPHKLCTSLGVDKQLHCVEEIGFLQEVGWQILHQFNSSGKIGVPSGDAYLDGNQWTQNLLSDVLGLAPTECSNETGIGMEGFKARIENMAIAMTNAMRVANSSSEITGTAWSTTQIIHINFLWLIYPLCTHICATIFILITIVSTRRQRLPTWKNSALALLRSADQDNQFSSKKDMRNAAKRSTLEFVPRGQTWRLEEK